MTRSDLTFNSSEIELVLYTGIYEISLSSLPSMAGIHLQLSDKPKCLELIIERKFWQNAAQNLCSDRNSGQFGLDLLNSLGASTPFVNIQVTTFQIYHLVSSNVWVWQSCWAVNSLSTIASGCQITVAFFEPTRMPLAKLQIYRFAIRPFPSYHSIGTEPLAKCLKLFQNCLTLLHSHLELFLNTN